MKKNQRLFSSGLEELNIYFGLAVLAVAAAEVAAAHKIPVADEQVARFITGSLFLNSLHIFFTFAMLYFLPGLQKWGKQRRRELRSVAWVIPAVVFVTILLLSAFQSQIFGEWKSISLLFTLAIIVAPVHHGLAQSCGLSYIYFGDDRRWHYRAERWCAALLIYAYVLWAFTGYLNRNSYASQVTGPVQYIAYGMFAAPAVFIVLASLSGRHQYGSNKFLFSLRFLLYPLVPFSNAATFGIGAIHGVEYFCVFKQMSGNSALEAPRKKTMLWTVLGLSLVGLVMLACRWPDGLSGLVWSSYSESPLLVRLLGGTLWGLTFLHYFYDRVLFRMRAAENRELILPLLRGYSEQPPSP